MDNKALKSRLSNKMQTLQPMTGIVDTNADFVALKNNTLDIIKENLKNQHMTFQYFDVVKSPSGGSTVFSVPGLSGDEAMKELTGIILDYSTPRAYWDTPDEAESCHMQV